MSYFLEQSINGLSLGCMYAFIALGYTMVYGIIKLINFAHGEFFMVGGMLGYLALFYLPVEQFLGAGQAPLIVALLVSMLVAAFGTAIFAVICERMLYKPLRGEGRIAAAVAAVYATLFILVLWKPVASVSWPLALLLLVGGVWLLLAVLPGRTDHLSRVRTPGGRIAALLTALGLSLALQNGVIWLYSANPRAWPEAKTFLRWDAVDAMSEAPDNLYRLQGTNRQIVVYAGQAVTPEKLTELKKTDEGLFMDKPFETASRKRLVFIALLVAGGGLYLLVLHTNLGKAMRAVSYNADAARLMGINANQVISFTFFIGAFLAGIGGVLYGLLYGKIDPFMGFFPGLKAFVAAVLGGIGSIPGAILGGVLLGLIEALVAGYGFSAYKDAIAFVILIVILLVKPTGLLGSFEGEKV